MREELAVESGDGQSPGGIELINTYWLCIDEGHLMFRHMCGTYEKAKEMGDKARKRYNLDDVEKFYICDAQAVLYDYKKEEKV